MSESKSAKKRAVVILGVTASGKSALALSLCAKYGGEIISADSMQVYRRMDIGTAKPSADELAAIPHHLINIRDISEPFSAADFITGAKAALADISSRGKLPFIVGGTGMYSDLLFNSQAFSETGPDTGVRDSLRAKAESEGADALWQYLRTIDPEAAAAVHPNNVRRVIRYLEIFLTTGLTPTETNERNNSFERLYDPLYICLERDSKEAYARIDERVDAMLAAGLEREARSLWEDGLESAPTASQAIGYKELFPYFRGTAEFGQCLDLIKRHSRNYAKRQKTYFKRISGIHLVDADSAGREVTELIEQ